MTLIMSKSSVYLLLLLSWLFSTHAVFGAVTPAHAAATVPVSVNISFKTAEPRAGQPVSPSVSFKRRSDQQPIPTTAFVKSHEQLLHMVGVGEDLDTFFHWHSAATYRQAFSVQNVVFPKAGTYLVALDGLLAEGPLASSTKLTVHEHAGHGRRLLQGSRDRSGNSLTQLLDRLGNALDERLYEAGIIEPKGAAIPSQGAAQHAAHSGHTRAVGVTSFGPALRTQVVFPAAGRYLLVGQVSRRELILLPVFVSCTGR